MSFYKFHLIVIALLIGGCGEFGDDLFPSDTDRRITSAAGETGPLPGQKAPDFSTVTSLNDSFSLSSKLSESGRKAFVLYFAMWCPICNSHLDHMLRHSMPRFPNVQFIVIDYISGSVNDVHSNVINNGYGASGFFVLADLADLGNSILDAYDGTMGTTVVIDSSGVIRMNEDYKDGTKLFHILETIDSSQQRVPGATL